MSWSRVGLLASVAWFGSCSGGWLLARKEATMDAASCTVLIDSSTGLLADGLHSASVTVIVRDDRWKPVPLQAVQVTATGSHNTVDQPELLTDERGRVTATISSTQAEVKTVLAVADPGRDPVLLPQRPTIEFLQAVPGD